LLITFIFLTLLCIISSLFVNYLFYADKDKA